ncbi:ABC transporter ATP-binding protein [Komagataeibacter sp. FNDCR2]|uniref:ABC transporter ATP-binding protein n=1 Tax=Komagataeibacter sp. FNDCR2 TaxID=2878682 RepID=UPI001E62CD59|nr:ATP-binding cassette domain-containing protein [Komagataeibacter sp. FNDCR2]MCE2574129.1 ATP-binding cassette domain-containing protein [Komagataeibacter sp. FNDCR2]
MIWLQAHNLEWQAPSSNFHLRISALSLKTGDRISIVGPSGSGKSTLLGLLALALRPSGADIFHLRTDTGKEYDLYTLWRKGKRQQLAALRSTLIGFVPQTSALLPFLTAQENILLPLQVTRRKASRKNLENLIEALDLHNCLHQRPATLSVGQRQRVAVARALVADPPLILADEPTASVPPEQARIIYGMLLNAPNSAVIMITHDRENACRAGFTPVEARLCGQKTTISWPVNVPGR